MSKSVTCPRCLARITNGLHEECNALPLKEGKKKTNRVDLNTERLIPRPDPPPSPPRNAI